MCQLYERLENATHAAAPRAASRRNACSDAVARAYVLAVALRSDDLAPLVQDRCGLGDLEERPRL
jgi:hypothetical protein